MTYVTFSLPDGDAEFEVEHFAAGRRFRWDEPPDPGEISLKEWGIWTSTGGDVQDAISLMGLVRMYTLARSITDEQAMRQIEDEAYEAVLQQLEDSYEED